MSRDGATAYIKKLLQVSRDSQRIAFPAQPVDLIFYNLGETYESSKYRYIKLNTGCSLFDVRCRVEYKYMGAGSNA